VSFTLYIVKNAHPHTQVKTHTSARTRSIHAYFGFFLYSYFLHQSPGKIALFILSCKTQKKTVRFQVTQLLMALRLHVSNRHWEIKLSISVGFFLSLCHIQACR